MKNGKKYIYLFTVQMKIWKELDKECPCGRGGRRLWKWGLHAQLLQVMWTKLLFILYYGLIFLTKIGMYDCEDITQIGTYGAPFDFCNDTCRSCIMQFTR